MGRCVDFTHRLASWQAALIVTGEKEFVDPPPLSFVPKTSEAEAILRAEQLLADLG